jgi:hypothetical protein
MGTSFKWEKRISSFFKIDRMISNPRAHLSRSMSSEMTSAEIILFLLRLLSALLLGVFLVALFTLMLRDLKLASQQTESHRRSYGQIIVLQQIDDLSVPTGQTYPLTPITTFGRAPTNSIPLNERFASAEHAQILLRDGQWWLEDRGSRNGTSLNGIPVTQPVIVTDGDVIGIGTLRFRLVLSST